MPVFSHLPYFLFPSSCRFSLTFRIIVLPSPVHAGFSHFPYFVFQLFMPVYYHIPYFLFPIHAGFLSPSICSSPIHAGFVSLSVFCLFLPFPHFRALRALRLRSSLSGTFLSPGYYIVNQYQLGVCPAICPIFHSSPSLSVPVAPHLSPPPTPSLVLVFFPPLIHSLPTSVSSVRRMPHGQASMFV